jgi:hypothetical protein
MDLTFKDGKSDPVKDLEAKLLKGLKDTAPAAQKLTKEDIVRIDVAGFVGPNDGSGITIAVLPTFSIPVNTTVEEVAMRVPAWPSLVGFAFTGGLPTTLTDHPQSAPVPASP